MCIRDSLSGDGQGDAETAADLPGGEDTVRPAFQTLRHTVREVREHLPEFTQMAKSQRDELVTELLTLAEELRRIEDKPVEPTIEASVSEVEPVAKPKPRRSRKASAKRPAAKTRRRQPVGAS